MTRRFSFQPLYLAILIIQLYFLIYHFSFLLVLSLTVSLLAIFKQYQGKLFLKISLILILFAFYFWQVSQEAIKADRETPQQLSSLQIIPDSMAVNGEQLRFKGKADGKTYQAFYLLPSRKEQVYFQKLNQAVTIQGKITLERAEPQRNFKGFDYQAYLKTQDIYRLAQVETIYAIKESQQQNFLDNLHLWRRCAISHIQKSFPAPLKHYMTGLLFGYLDKSFDAMTDLYSDLGIIHLFALSGMQVGFFLGIFRTFLLRLGLKKENLIWLQMPFSVVYAGLTGFSVSVIRSLLQALLSLVGVKNRDNLGITMIVMFFLVPHYLLTAGGQLSFVYAFLLAILNFDNLDRKKCALFQTLSLSLGALPFLVWYFSSFQPLSILLTALFSLIFDFALLPLLSILFLLSPLVKLTFVNIIFVLMDRLMMLLGQIIGKPLVFGSLSLLLFLALLVALACLYDYRYSKKARIGLGLVILCLFLFCKYPPSNEVTMVDVGQGDSLLIRDVKGKVILIDVGGKVSFTRPEKWQQSHQQSNAKRTLIPYLKSRGIGTIDQLVLTHTDADHIGDLEEVARAVTIGEILVSPGSLTKASFVSRLKRLKIAVRRVDAGTRLPIMGSHLQVLYPNQVGDGGNNDSLVLYGKLLDKTFLFTGDLEKEGEQALLAAYPNLTVDILKVGHHGSKGSSSPEFLNQLAPKVALISAGKKNRYQHPHQETLLRLDKERTATYRTDKMGAVRFEGLQKWHLKTVH